MEVLKEPIEQALALGADRIEIEYGNRKAFIVISLRADRRCRPSSCRG